MTAECLSYWKSSNLPHIFYTWPIIIRVTNFRLDNAWVVFGRIQLIKACFPLSECVRANREKCNLIGWRQTLTTSPLNHIRFLLVRAKKNRYNSSTRRYCILTMKPQFIFYQYIGGSKHLITVPNWNFIQER